MFDFENDLSLNVALEIAEGTLRVAPARTVLARCDAAFERMQTCIDERRHVYGITTGFGPLANRLIDPADGERLQQNLIHHLATGLGDPLPWRTARAICLSRLTTVLRGFSGASPGTIEALVAILNSDLAPVLPERGTVGASGDLTPLAHLVLVLQGRGDVLTRDGHILPSSTGLAALRLQPLSLKNRDGLALVNGTSAMTGIAACNAGTARRLVDAAIRISAALMEVLSGRTEAWSPILAQLRPHPGQINAVSRLNASLHGATRCTDGYIADRILSDTEFGTEPLAGQDAYSLRCVPQVIGAVLDTLAWHDTIVASELNAVTDNPVFPLGQDTMAIHGGNFMGQHVGLASDALGTALVALAGLVERQIARITDETMNRGLPAFLHRGKGGLNSGFMGAQVTATATLAEMRQRGPASVHSISTNGSNQDVVSMGTIAARGVSAHLDLLSEILAINALCVVQAMEHRQQDDPRPFSDSACALRTRIRAVSPPLEEDRPLSKEIAAVAKALRVA